MRLSLLSRKTKLLIFEYKERFPQLSAEEISLTFFINLRSIERLFKQEYIIIPSKLNKK
jgi:hypothetical protein